MNKKLDNVNKRLIGIITIVVLFLMRLHGQNALTATYDCSTSCIDLQINGGFSPYEVEWQVFHNGAWIKRKNWPKLGLNGNDGNEDLCNISVTESTEFKAIVHDDLCGMAEITITVEPCPCGLEIETLNYSNVSECSGTEGDVFPPQPPTDACDGSISISVSGNTGSYNIAWSSGQTGQTSLNNLCTGTYTVTVSEGSCSVTETFDICCCSVSSAVDSPYPQCQASTSNTIDANITSPTSSTAKDGAIDLVVTGGPNEYKWTGPNGFKSSQEDISGLGIGTYCVTVTNGCSAPINKCFTLVDCSSVTINVTGSVTNTCNGYSVGIISVTQTGGISPYKYKWSNGKTTSTISNLSAGQYCVTVTDASGCRGVRCFTVGFNNVTYLNSTKPCGKYVLCNGVPTGDFIPSDVFCGYFDHPDCRIERCRCSSTNGIYYEYSHDYLNLDYNPNTCQIYGQCPQGQWQLAASGYQDQFFHVYFDPTCNCFGCQDVYGCRFNGGFIINEIYSAGLRIEQEKSTKCKEENMCLWKFYCDDELTAQECRACAGGGLKELQSYNSQINEISLSNLLTSLKNSGAISDSNSYYILDGIDLDISVSEYMLLIRNLSSYKIKEIKYNEVNDTLTCTANCNFIEYKSKDEKNSFRISKVPKIYPNPTTGEIYIDLETKILSTVEVEVLDNSFRILRTYKLLPNAENSSLKLDLSELNNGSYFIKVLDSINKGESKVYHIIKI